MRSSGARAKLSHYDPVVEQTFGENRPTTDTQIRNIPIQLLIKPDSDIHLVMHE